MSVKDNRSFFLLSVLAVAWSLAYSTLMANTYDTTNIDGSLDDWNATERLNSDKDALYAKYVGMHKPTYLFAIETSDKTIGPETTIWLNTDDDEKTGHQVWDKYGGAEYYINIHSDGKPYLYNGKRFGEFVIGPLEHSYSVDGKTVEIALPASSIGSPEESIGLIGDINNDTFLPAIYSNGQFILYNSPIASTDAMTVIKSYGEIDLDGSIDDWSAMSLVNLPLDLPPTLVNSAEKVYVRSVTSPEPTYLFAVETNGTVIRPETTFWLNTDNDAKTGHQVWGNYVGAEYYVNISPDKRPFLYKGDPYGEPVGGALAYSYNEDGTILEFAIPAVSIGSPKKKISLMGDINNAIFFPADYSTGQFTVTNSSIELPPRKDLSKRVAIVYSETSRSNFFDTDEHTKKAHTQLFMTTQNQSMMAGIPFDLLNEDDLTDLSRLVDYDVLIFPSFASVPSDKSERILENLYQAVYHYGIGIITSGDWLTNDSDGTPIEGDAYRHMKQILGIGRVTGAGPVEITLKAGKMSHPAMDRYAPAETISTYGGNHWYSYFSAASNGVMTQPVSTLATQAVTGSISGEYDAVLAIETGARHVHFSSLEFMGDTNLLWSALQWVIYGKETPIALKMGRQKSLFIARNDLDQSKEEQEEELSDRALLSLLEIWKSEYDFVGSYFIGPGKSPSTKDSDWNQSTSFYQKCMALGNEIGTHSFALGSGSTGSGSEYGQAMDIISEQLAPTWRTQRVRSIPYALQSDADVERYWLDEYRGTMRHASQPIIHWPWHDHASINGTPYDVAMFTDSIKTAYDDDAEFLTSKDVAQRITSFKETRLSVEYDGQNILVNTDSRNAGKFSLAVELRPGKVIEKVDDWYAYDDERVFLDRDGGDYVIHQGDKAAKVTHITALPMRADLLSVKGDGNTLSFSFEGEGKVRLALAQKSQDYMFTGADKVSTINSRTVELDFDKPGVHSVTTSLR